MILEWEFLLKWYLNKIFLLQQYSNKIKLLSFIKSFSAPVISYIFNLNGENQTGTIRDQKSRVKKNFSSPLNWAERREGKFQSHPSLIFKPLWAAKTICCVVPFCITRELTEMQIRPKSVSFNFFCWGWRKKVADKNLFPWKIEKCEWRRRHDIQYNVIRHNVTRHNVTRHNNMRHEETKHSV